MESIYTQMFHEGRADDFEQFVSDFGHKCFRWDTVLDAYEQQFGKDNIIPRRYHEKFFPERNSLIQDFCDIINASDLIIKTPSRQVNAGFSRDAMEIARICNPHLTQQEHGRLRAYLQSVSPKKPMERYHYFNAETRQRYMESFEKSNSEVAMRFFPDSRGILFPPPEDDTHVDYPGLSMESVCRTFMLCLLELDRAFAGQQSFTGTKLRKIENKLYNTI
ncbi:MAG: hypothetical protein KKC99_07405, partial [Proteobacteria bacterium]|nr:hypothetical protein [Pseudomonadota bacterium]